MTAQTFTGSPRAAAGFPVYAGTYGNLRVAYGEASVTENPEDGDIWPLCKLPKGAVVLGGYFYASDIDSGTETLDIDLGYAANGVDTADPDAYVNAGVLSGDAITDFPLTGAANVRLITGIKAALGAETTVQAEANAAANAGGTGTLGCVIFYDLP